MEDTIQSGPALPPTPWITINSVHDLMNFLDSVHPGLKDYEVHAEYQPDNYRLVTQAKVVDDQVILRLDVAESDPFEHEE